MTLCGYLIVPKHGAPSVLTEVRSPGGSSRVRELLTSDTIPTTSEAKLVSQLARWREPGLYRLTLREDPKAMNVIVKGTVGLRVSDVVREIDTLNQASRTRKRGASTETRAASRKRAAEALRKRTVARAFVDYLRPRVLGELLMAGPVTPEDPIPPEVIELRKRVAVAAKGVDVRVSEVRNGSVLVPRGTPRAPISVTVTVIALAPEHYVVTLAGDIILTGREDAIRLARRIAVAVETASSASAAVM